MIEKLETAISALAEKASTAPTSHEAMQFAQAAYNLANVLMAARNK